MEKKVAHVIYSIHAVLLLPVSSPQDPEHQNDDLNDLFRESIDWKKTVSTVDHAIKLIIK